MLNLAVKTKLEAGKALERAYRFFVEEQKLTLVEWIAHLHAEQGACELRISGGEIRGKSSRDSREILRSEVDRLEREYGFRLAYYGLHIHASPDADVGHLMVAIHGSDPVEVTFESQELDFPVKEFSRSLPGA